MFHKIHKINLLFISSITLYSGLCRSISGSNYSFKSIRVRLYQSYIPGLGQFLLFFLADPLKLSDWMGSFEELIFRSHIFFSSLCFGWAIQKHSENKALCASGRSNA